MDEQFEKNLNDKVQESYEIKTKPEAILSAYHAREKKKSSASYKIPFYGALGALGCAVVALAFVLPKALTPSSTVPTSSDLAYSVSELSVSPLKNDKDTLAYEISSLYPLLKKQQASVSSLKRALPQQANTNGTSFAQVVNEYEEIQNPVRQSFNGVADTLAILDGSYTGNYGTYDHQMVIPDIGTLIFSATSSSGSWSKLTGELMDEEDTEYRLSGINETTAESSGMVLRLTGEDEGEYAVVKQNTKSGVFYFSFDLFEEGETEYHFSIRRLETGNHLPFIVCEYFEKDAFESTIFRVLENTSDQYTVTLPTFGKFLLSYNGSQRIYTNNGTTITKN
jgi:hypothetical protein